MLRVLIAVLLLAAGSAEAQAPSFCGRAPAGWTGWVNYRFTDSIPLTNTNAVTLGPISLSARDTLNSAVRVTGLGAPQDTVWRLRWRTTVGVQTPPVNWGTTTSPNSRSVYVCWRVRFNSWSNANNVSQKFLFVRPADDSGSRATNNSVLNLYKFGGVASDYRLVFDPNDWQVYGVSYPMDSLAANATQPANGAGWAGDGGNLTDGQAHVVEIVESGNTGSAFNGKLRVWIDGVLIASSDRIRYWLATQAAQARQFGYLYATPIGGGVATLSGAPNATMDLLTLYATSSSSVYTPSGSALDSTATADSVTVATASDTLLRRLLGREVGKRSATPFDSVYVLLHGRAPNKLGAGGIRDTTWAGSLQRSVLVLANDSTGWTAPTYVSGLNRHCVTNRIALGAVDTVTAFSRTFRWVSLFGDRALTKPLGVLRLTAPATFAVGRTPRIPVGALRVCAGQ